MGDFNRSVWSFPFVFRHVSHRNRVLSCTLPDCTKKCNKRTPNVRAHCTAKPVRKSTQEIF